MLLFRRRRGWDCALDAGNSACRSDIASPYHSRYALVTKKALQLENGGVGSVAAQPYRRRPAADSMWSGICLGFSQILRRHAPLPELFILCLYIRP
jgi:hypothetical protein